MAHIFIRRQKTTQNTISVLRHFGSIDELIAWIGISDAIKENNHRKEMLVYIQDQLMASIAALAYDNVNPSGLQVLPDVDCVVMLEQEIDRMEASLKP